MTAVCNRYHLRVLENEGLSEKEVEQLFKLFSKNKTDKFLKASTTEVLFHLHEKAETFMSRIITFFARNKEKIDFQEFVFAVWNFCTLRSKQKSHGTILIKTVQSFLILCNNVVFDCPVCLSQISSYSTCMMSKASAA